MALLAHVVDSSSDVSSDRLNNHKFWSKPLDTSPEVSSRENSSRRLHTTTVVAIADEPSTNTTSYEYTIGDPSDDSPQPIIEQQSPQPMTTNLTVFNATSSSTDSTKRYQTKMLLASLIEHFCRAYGDTPDANRKVFFLICQTLRSLGIIDAEFVDEMTSVRSSFQQAFHKLFYTAVQTVRNQDLVSFDDNLPRLIKPATDSHDECSSSDEITCSSSSSATSFSNKNQPPRQKPRPIRNKNYKEQEYFSSSRASSGAGTSFATLNNLSSSSNTLHSFVHHGAGNFFHNLSIQNSRYNNDFVEISLLGKGGFASAFRARNKLDGIDYAVKKIRLGNDIEESDRLKENPYEKIFREIKNLARLEHVNVIRYYSSWLEFDDTTGPTDGSDWEDDTSKPSKSFYSTGGDEESSVFEGRDPTFDDNSTSSLGNYFGYQPPSESGMSHIHFGNDSSGGSGSYEVGVNDSSSNNVKKSPPMIPQQSGWTLFIQMQLCPTTLHDYIRFRNKQYAETTASYGDHLDTNRNIEIFSQILQGTAYIHDQGLIHRDLKPSNIFLSMPNASAYLNHHNHANGRRRASSAAGCLESTIASSSYRSSYDAVVSEHGLRECMWEESWVPKIGDFGLAAETMDESSGDNSVLVPTPMPSTPPSPKLQSQASSNSITITSDDNIDMALINKLKINTYTNSTRPKRPKPRRTRTLGVGTRTYASPEQLAIPAQPYDEKVDIYSLGIILFELFHPFATGMERADSLDKLKRGVFPGGFLELYPKVSALILWMMDEKPDRRPTAHQLLQFELFSHPEEHVDIYYVTLQTQLQKKSSIIEELKKTVERVEIEKQQALSEMQQRLDEMQLQLDRLQNVGDTITTIMSSEASGEIKKCILTQSPSFLKTKKEVRWSSLNTDFK